MKGAIKKILTGFAVVPALALMFSFASPLISGGVALAATDTCAGDASGGVQGGANCAKTDDQRTELFGGDESIFKIITNTLLFIIGAVAVIMLIYGGIRYTISGGESASITAAKNTILYAVVGIIVALLGFALVNWVIDAFVAK
ncbi:MAG: hypothetical protein WBB94_01655 [Candidatus Saccharimonadaceae bacterium]